VPAHVCETVKTILTDELWKITERFCKTYMKKAQK